jgi:agmatinase
MTASPPFLGFPDHLADGRMPCAVIFGAGHGSTYPGKDSMTAREVHAQGVEAALRLIPEGVQVVVTLDCDGLDPGIMPGVAARTPGGLTYTQVIDLIAGLGRRARIAGFDLVELYPPADIDGLSALTAARLLVNLIGTVVRQI